MRASMSRSEPVFARANVYSQKPLSLTMSPRGSDSGLPREKVMSVDPFFGLNWWGKGGYTARQALKGVDLKGTEYIDINQSQSKDLEL